MRADELIQKLEELKAEHGNCYVLIDSDYIGETSVERVTALPYSETTYFVVKA